MLLVRVKARHTLPTSPAGARRPSTDSAKEVGMSHPLARPLQRRGRVQQCGCPVITPVAGLHGSPVRLGRPPGVMAGGHHQSEYWVRQGPGSLYAKKTKRHPIDRRCEERAQNVRLRALTERQRRREGGPIRRVLSPRGQALPEHVELPGSPRDPEVDLPETRNDTNSSEPERVNMAVQKPPGRPMQDLGKTGVGGSAGGVVPQQGEQLAAHEGDPPLDGRIRGSALRFQGGNGPPLGEGRRSGITANHMD